MPRNAERRARRTMSVKSVAPGNALSVSSSRRGVRRGNGNAYQHRAVTAHDLHDDPLDQRKVGDEGVDSPFSVNYGHAALSQRKDAAVKRFKAVGSRF